VFLDWNATVTSVRFLFMKKFVIISVIFVYIALIAVNTAVALPAINVSNNSHVVVVHKRFLNFFSSLARGISGLFKGIKGAGIAGKSAGAAIMNTKAAKTVVDVAKSDLTRNSATVGFGAASLSYNIKKSKNDERSDDEAVNATDFSLPKNETATVT
jgi:hypothetical protein